MSPTEHARARRVGLSLAGVALLAAVALLATSLANDADASAARLAPGPTRVASVNLSQLLEGLDERTQLERQLDEVITRRQNQLDEIVGELRLKSEDIELLPDDSPQRRELAREIRELEITARARREFLQNEISTEKGGTLVTLFRKIQDASETIAGRDGWDIVLIDDSGLPLPPGANEQQALGLILQRRVLHASANVDITNDVQTYMNNQYNSARP